jgi:type 1 glutamine amidotransferase
MTAPRVLMLAGGWEGHEPLEVARVARDLIFPGLEVHQTSDLGCVCPEVLREFDLFVPIWTFGTLPDNAEQSLLFAVEHGMGVLAWHGFTSAFLHSRPLKHLIGGQFVAHPGGDSTTYRVEFSNSSPLTVGLDPLTVTSEQYYLLVDPAVDVVATTVMSDSTMPWLSGVRMPVAWTRRWGDGRVFYCSLGHTAAMLREPQLSTLIRRAIAWAARRRVPQTEPKSIAGKGITQASPRSH